MSEYEVRPAEIADARGCAEVNIAAWLATYRGIMSDEYLDSLDVDRFTHNWRRNLESWRRQIAEADVTGISDAAPRTFVAIRSVPLSAPTSGQRGRIVGFGAICPPRDPGEVLDRLPEITGVPLVGLGQLSAINMHPDVFGTGAAQQLFSRLEDELRGHGCEQAYLMVAEGNSRAGRFYSKQGWQRTEITHFFTRTPDPVPERLYWTRL